MEQLRLEEWSVLDRKMEMLVEELEAYAEASSAYDRLESWYAGARKKQAELKKELADTLQSPQTHFGLIRKVSKDDKLAELRGQLARVDNDIYIGEKLVALASELLVRNEIELIKQRKHQRFNEFINDFAQARLKRLSDEAEFWTKILEAERPLLNSEILEKKLASGQMRITNLADIKISETK